jgi:sarcosine oxidase, subunit beta
MAVTADAVIIGGGVMGCSILYNLAARGLKNALLLERDVLGSGSTGRSSSIIRMHYSNEVHARMAWMSLELFRNFDQIVGGDCGFIQTGFLVFAGEDEVEAFQGNIAMQQQVGIQTSILSLVDAREIAPGFSVDHCAAIAYEPLSGYADASGTAYAYATRARQLEARVRLQTPATGIEMSGGRVVAVNTARERIETPLAVVATGPWSRRFLGQHGIDLPLEATRHEVVILKRPLDRLPYHPGGADFSHLVYWRPESAGLTLVGNGNTEEVIEDLEIYAPQASQGFIQEIWGRLPSAFRQWPRPSSAPVTPACTPLLPTPIR